MRRKIMKKLVGIILIAVLLLAACAPAAPATPTPAPATAAPTAAPAATATPAPGPAEPDDIELRFAWWGSDSRHERTLAVIDNFERDFPHITIMPEFAPFDGFQDALNVQIGGGNPPDLIQQGGDYPLMVNMGVVVELESFLGSEFDDTYFDKDVLETGSMNGHLYAISLGTNMPTMVYNKTLLEEVGAALPPERATWDELAAYFESIQPLMPSGVWAMADLSQFNNGLAQFLRMRDRPFWNNHETQVIESDLVDWLTMVQDWRDRGFVPPYDVSIQFNGVGPEQSAMVTRQVAVATFWSNQLVGFQGLTEDVLELTHMPVPRSGELAGLWIQPSQYLCVARVSENPAAAVQFIDFFVNNPESGLILGNDRGISSNSRVREAKMGIANEIDEKVYAYYAVATERTRAMYHNSPVQAQWNNENDLIQERFGFGMLTIQQAAKEMYDTIQRLLG
jgi:multiple sugar transport system substrate-binding protein